MSDFLGFVKDVAVSLASGGLAAAALIWLAKTTISERLRHAIRAEYDRDLEHYKDTLKAAADSKLEVLRMELKSKADIELARVSSTLNIEAAERQVASAGLYERRADALKAIYAWLTDLHGKLGAYVHPFEMAGGPTKEDLRLPVADAYNTFAAGYKPLLIFVPKKTAIDLRNVEFKARSAYNRFYYNVQQGRDSERTYEQWTRIDEFLEQQIQPAMQSLEDDFREMLEGRLKVTTQEPAKDEVAVEVKPVLT